VSKKVTLTCVASLVAALVLIAGTYASAAGKAGPGPVVVTFMERVETHSDAPDSSAARNINGESYIYTLLSAYRRLGGNGNVSGSVYAMNKYSIDEGQSASYIYGIDIMDKLTGKWSSDVGYSYTSNPELSIDVRSTQSSRWAFGLDFKVNPLEKYRRKWSLKTSYNTATDFSAGRTLSEKLTVTRNISKRWNYALAYQFVWGLQETTNATGICGICREQYANQYYADFNFKASKKDKIGIGYLFLKNLYNGARSDDSIAKLSYYRTLK
jgi:hypothetical protein